MKQEIAQIAQYLPFLGVMMTQQQGGTQSVIVRLVEAGIIGGVVMYGTTISLGEKVKSVEKDIINVQSSVNEIRRTIEDMKSDIYVPAFHKDYLNGDR